MMSQFLVNTNLKIISTHNLEHEEFNFFTFFYLDFETSRHSTCSGLYLSPC
jgi:hypothetical protein